MKPHEHVPMQRFRFASFDAKQEPPPAPPPPEKQEAAPPPGPLTLPLLLPAITEEDMQNARNDAQAQGYREGFAAAQAKFDKERAAREDALRSLLLIVANRVTIAAETHAIAMRGRQELMGKIIMAVARKVAGDALKRAPYASVETLLADCAALIAGVPKVKITVSSALAEGLRQRLDTVKPSLQNFTGELKVEENPALLDQDCRVEWGNGYAERSEEALWEAIEAIIIKTNVTT